MTAILASNISLILCLWVIVGFWYWAYKLIPIWLGSEPPLWKTILWITVCGPQVWLFVTLITIGIWGAVTYEKYKLKKECSTTLKASSTSENEQDN